MTQLSASTVKTATESSATCGCADPVPVQRAARKGAAVTVCQRCGLRVPLRLR